MNKEVKGMELSVLGGAGSQIISGSMLGIVVFLMLIIGLGQEKKNHIKIFSFTALLFLVLASIFLLPGIAVYYGGEAQTHLPEGTFLVENASSAPDGNIHLVIRGRAYEADKDSTATKYVILKNTEVKNFPAEPIWAGTFKLVVQDIQGAGQEWRTYTFVDNLK